MTLKEIVHLCDLHGSRAAEVDAKSLRAWFSELRSAQVESNMSRSNAVELLGRAGALEAERDRLANVAHAFELENAELREAHTNSESKLELELFRNRLLREALTWAVGFIRCNVPSAAGYPDFRNAEGLLADGKAILTGEFTLCRHRAELAEEELKRTRALFSYDSFPIHGNELGGESG